MTTEPLAGVKEKRPRGRPRKVKIRPPGWEEACLLVNTCACYGAESLLAKYGPARILAAWRALEGE